MNLDDKVPLPVTEQENPDTLEISSLPTPEILRLINKEDAGVAGAVRTVLPDIVRAVEGIVSRLEKGGHLIYVGTGTSGRLGVLEAAECPPTFGTPPELVQAIIAGGEEAVCRAVEGSEDDAAAGAHDLEERALTGDDAVVGITASGHTPYTVCAVRHARSVGAFTVAIACVPDSLIGRAAEVSIAAIVGPEVIAGSTRLKAGTAQKMILNMISTAVMIRLGYVSGNRMTNLKIRNTKLRARALRILREESDLNELAAQAVLDAANDNLPVALVMGRTRCTRAEAEEALKRTKGVVRQAIEILAK
jgi:N-acetylmuramic acid 6-phosphate etherase